MFSKCIWEDELCAVYERSSIPIDKRLPHTDKFGDTGAVFCAYQMLGTNPFPLVFCLHDYDSTDRERNALHEFEVNEVVLKIATLVSPKAATEILEKMWMYWNTYPTKKREIVVTGWSPIINALIRNMQWSIKAVKEFRQKYPNLLCADRVSTISERNRRNQAVTWAKKALPEHRIVKNTFCLLGYPFLEEECERHGGFVEERNKLNMKGNCLGKSFKFVSDFDIFYAFPT